MLLPRISRASRTCCLVSLAAASLAIQVSAQEGELRPTWECLPEETALAVRIPNGSAISQTLTDDTKLGAVLFSDARMDAFRKLIREAEVGEGENLVARLAEYGLTPDDFPELLAGESGYALVVDQPEDVEPLVIGIGWLEPGEDLAQRAYEAAGRAIELHEDDEHPPQRVDIELADQPVMEIAVPVIRIEYGEFELPDNYDSLSEEEQSQAWDQAYKEYEQSASERVDHGILLVTTLGSRLLVGYAINEVSDESREATTERLEMVFARLIAAHRGQPGGFLPRVLRTRGIGPVLDPEGITVAEVVGDVAPLLKLLRAQPDFQSDPDGEKVMNLLGADQLGPFALRMVLDGPHLHTRLFLSAPEPRRGLLRLLDQQPLPSDVPAWVPATAISYSHFSFDLGRAYRIVKEEVSRQFPEQADQWFGMAEMQVQNFTQAGLGQILGSLGSRHVAISFEPEMVQQELGDDSTAIEMPQDKTAFVSPVTDEEVWGRLLKAIGTFAAFTPGLESTDEQGFHGWRLQNDGTEGGLVTGNGYVVLAVGRGTLETVLSSLNNPPPGRDSLRESELVGRASALLDLRPAIGLEITDANRYARVARRMFQSLIQQMEAYQDGHAEEGEPQPDLPWLEIAQALLPDEDEMENIFGAAVTEVQVDENGLLVRSVNELPPPN